MSIKSSNKHVIEFEKQAALAANGSNKPYAAMIRAAGLAACEGAITKADRDAFYAKLEKARPSATHKTMLDNRKSEAWSCVKLAFEFKECAPTIFANLEKAGATPTAIYDIACSIRKKASFAEGEVNEKKAIGLHEDSGKAPTVEEMTAAVKYANSYRNGLSGVSAVRPLEEVLASMVKTLTAFRDGKRHPDTGKTKDAKGNAYELPRLTALDDIVNALDAMKNAITKAKSRSHLRSIEGGKGRAAANGKALDAKIKRSMR